MSEGFFGCIRYYLTHPRPVLNILLLLPFLTALLGGESAYYWVYNYLTGDFIHKAMTSSDTRTLHLLGLRDGMQKQVDGGK